ncbi:MAG: hypothetical protein JWQ49_2018 [Edaphobacter sp.]|nr:hypothetical protein [Edaphobacter sp.]
MALQPKSKSVALRALLAVTWAEERRLLTTINSDQTSVEEMSTALNALARLWSNIVLKIADIEDATVASASSHLPPDCNPEQTPALPEDRRVGNVGNDEPGLCAPSECAPNSA